MNTIHIPHPQSAEGQRIFREQFIETSVDDLVQALEIAAIRPIFYLNRVNGRPDTREPFTKLRSDVERAYRAANARLMGLMKCWPRRGGETIAAYMNRTFYDTGSRVALGNNGVLTALAAAHAGLLWLDAKEAAEKEAAAARERGKEQARYEALQKRAQPDPEQIRKMLVTIDTARAAEELLASIGPAIEMHLAAQAARAGLDEVFNAAALACDELGDTPPAPPSFGKAPDEVLALMARIAPLTMR